MSSPQGIPIWQVDAFADRWFTPATEVDLCGHATLAAVHTLIEQGRVEPNQPIRFQTRSGELPCTQSGSRITLDFPATPPSTVDHAEDPVSAAGNFEKIHCDELLAALGLSEATVLRTKFDLVVVCDNANTVESLRPNFNALQQIPTRGVMVTALQFKQTHPIRENQ